MPVFAFMGSSLLRQDDSYTFDVINRTLESVVPKLVKVIIFLVHYMYMHVVQGVFKIHVVQRVFSNLITFSDVHVHVIRICSKIGPKSLYYSTMSLVEFHEKLQGEKSPFLLHFLMHIHVLMLCRKFELIPIKIGFFKKFFDLLQNLVKVPVL